MNNLACRIAAREEFPGGFFGFEFLDAAVFVHHFPAPESDKSTATGWLYTVS